MMPGSIVELLGMQAAVRGERPAYTFLPERGGAAATLTYSELNRRARALAGRLLERARPGDRAVLLFQPGLDMVVALFGCMAAGLVAVPLMLPRRAGARDASLAVLADCTPVVALTGPGLLETRPDLVERFAGAFTWMEVDAAEERPGEVSLPRVGGEALALLQYTSGSTSAPKGVMVGHGNMLANVEMIRVAVGHGEGATTVGWVPLFHDMGMVIQVMAPLYVGGHSVLMAPAAFMQRPLRWLRAISDWRAEVTSAPNFAFELCVARLRPELMEGVDLSCLKVAMNGAEPVHAGTVARFIEAFAPYGFAAGAMYPAYGLAEATLLVSGFRRGDGMRVEQTAGHQAVACGRSLPGERVAVVDPECGVPRGAGAEGEIWVSGPNVAQGYWGRAEATNEVFRARMEGDAAAWLRTGDLGFLTGDGALCVTGRIKDLIVIRGVNHYPQDIERTVQDADPALRRDGGAAFSVPGEEGTERLVVVQEVERTQRQGVDPEEVVARVREAVAAQHELSLHEVVLIRPGTLPKTTSGKVQRSLARRLWEAGALASMG